MKKSYLLLLLVLCFNELDAQGNVSKQDTIWAYGEIVGSLQFYGNGYRKVEVEVSQATTLWAVAPVLPVDPKNGKPIKFETMADAMNYLSNQGWELYQATSLGLELSTEHHWIIRRKVVRNAEGKFVPVE